MKHYYKLLLLTALLSIQGFSSRALASVPSPVDSICYLIQGDWYYVYGCMGFTGKCDSVYSTTIHRIERMANTDTVTWKTFKNGALLSTEKYLINYRQSMLSNSKKWMLSTIPSPAPPPTPSTVGYSTGLSLSFMLQSDGLRMGLALDAYDGGGATYARTMRPHSAYHERVDSIADCLRGDWYDVYKCLGFSGICDSIYSNPKVSLTHLPGSDSLTWGGMKYRLYESNDNITGQTRWMISTTLNNYSPDGIHVLPVLYPISYLISCNNGAFTFEENIIDGQTIVYTHNARTNIADLENVAQNKPFTIINNPVANCLRIAGSTPIESIQIADIRGHRIYSKKGDSKTLDVSYYPKGIYLVRISYKGGVETLKMVKK